MRAQSWNQKVQYDKFADVTMTSSQRTQLPVGPTRRPLKVRRASKSVPRAINSPQHPRLDQNGKIGFLGAIWTFFLYSQHISPPKKHKNISKFLDSSLFSKNKRQCSYPPSSSPWFHTLDLRFKGYGCSFLATIHTPFPLKLHQASYPFFLLE